MPFFTGDSSDLAEFPQESALRDLKHHALRYALERGPAWRIRQN